MDDLPAGYSLKSTAPGGQKAGGVLMTPLCVCWKTLVSLSLGEGSPGSLRCWLSRAPRSPTPIVHTERHGSPPPSCQLTVSTCRHSAEFPFGPTGRAFSSRPPCLVRPHATISKQDGIRPLMLGTSSLSCPRTF